MPEFVTEPLRVQDNQNLRVSRSSFRDVGIDDFTQPPAQNPDRFMQLLNIQPPEKGVLERRWAIRPFVPKVDAGVTIDDDELPGPFFP